MIAPSSSSALYDVHTLAMRYLIMMDFDNFLSPKVVSKWTYPIVSIVSPAKLISCFGNVSIWLSGMPNCWNVD